MTQFSYIVEINRDKEVKFETGIYADYPDINMEYDSAANIINIIETYLSKFYSSVKVIGFNKLN